MDVVGFGKTLGRVLLFLLNCHLLLLDSLLADHPDLLLVLSCKLMCYVFADGILVDPVALHVGYLLDLGWLLDLSVDEHLMVNFFTAQLVVHV